MDFTFQQSQPLQWLQLKHLCAPCHAISGQGSVLPLFFNDMVGVSLYNGHRIIDFTQLSDPPFSGNVQQALATHLCSSSHHCCQSWPSAPVDTPPSSILPLNRSTCTQCISLYTATEPVDPKASATSHCPFRGWALNCALSTSLCSSLHRCHQHLNDSYSYRDEQGRYWLTITKRLVCVIPFFAGASMVELPYHTARLHCLEWTIRMASSENSIISPK